MLENTRTSELPGPGAQHASPDTARVLVVDDDPALLLLLKETLREAGFEVLTAASGSEAIGSCEDFRPDLALLDINMPGMNGIRVCEEIRQLCGTEFPIVMVTSVHDATSIQAAFDAGATDFIIKPINWPLFQRRVESIVVDWHRAVELNESNQRLAALQRIAPEQVMLVSRNGVIVEDLKERTGAKRPKRVAVFPTLDELYGVRAAARFKQCISSVLKTGRTKSLRFSYSQWGMENHCEAEFLVDGRERVIVVVQPSDDTARASKEVYDLAFFDPATDLPNNHLFRRFAEKACTDAMLAGRGAALVNVAFDTATGPALADEAVAGDAATRLASAVARHGSALPIGDGDSARRLSRYHENEFLALIADPQSAGDVERLVDDVREAFSAGPDCADSGTSPVIGIAVLPGDGTDFDTLLRASRAARQEAESGGKSACFHSSAASVPALATLDSASELRDAMEKGQLELHFQPRVHAHTGRVTCIEALLRWNHPIRGYVGLGEVLHLAKATGIIFELGEWVMRAACEAALGWPAEHRLRVSVNLSRQELLRDSLATQLEELLADTGLEPHRLELELTEAALLRAEGSPAILGAVKSLGVGIVLDDFGTGHSSLASLRDYPIDALKIDASFVSRALRDSADAGICEVIIMMAHKMGLTAVAEGVETVEQLELLKSLGCDEVQGFLISRPLSATDLPVRLRAADLLPG